MFQPLIGTIKTGRKNIYSECVFSLVSTPYRDDKNNVRATVKFIEEFLFQSLIGTIKTRASSLTP
jgi:hypothetical protein